MCARYSIDDYEEIMEMREIIIEAGERFKNTPELAAMKTGEIFPTNIVPIITSANENKQVSLMKWGFPRYAGSGVIINARSETAHEKRMFSSAVESKRCLVPATAYYEWSHGTVNSDKRKFLIRAKATPMLYFAGIYNIFTDKNGNRILCFAIITADANESVKSIHDRMPYVLTGKKKDIWLHDYSSAKAILQEKCETELDLALVSGL